MKETCEISGIELDTERAEELMYPSKLVQDLGFQSLDHFEEFRLNAIRGAVEADDYFIVSLGHALDTADHKQAVRLIWAFRDDFEYCAMFWRMAEAKRKATSES